MEYVASLGVDVHFTKHEGAYKFSAADNRTLARAAAAHYVDGLPRVAARAFSPSNLPHVYLFTFGS